MATFVKSLTLSTNNIVKQIRGFSLAADLVMEPTASQKWLELMEISVNLRQFLAVNHP
jgi:hypothetical protein